jgi:hypothetical protein
MADIVPVFAAAKRRRFFDLFVIPLVVGLILALASFLIPRILEAGKRLSYVVDKPTDYLSQRLQGVTIQVNGVPTANVFLTKVRLWNSGGVALKDVGVLVEFDAPDQAFRILNVAHTTKPEREFGSIAQANPDANSTRFTYSLLNRGDEDTISFLTNESAEPKIYAKAEDLKVLQATLNRRALLGTSVDISLIVGLIGLLASVLSVIISAVKTRQELKGVWVRRNAVASKLAEEAQPRKEHG